MKQKIVIKVFSLTGKKSQSRALRIVVSVQGVESARLGEKDKNQLEVVGDGVDAVKLTNRLRKRMEKRKIGRLCRRRLVHVELVSVTTMDGKKEEKKDEKKKDEKKQEPKVHPYTGGSGVPQFYVHELRTYDDHYPCSIM